MVKFPECTLLILSEGGGGSPICGPTTGTVLLAGVATPNCPTELEPQAQTKPSFFSAKLWEVPPATAKPPVNPVTVTGTNRCVMLPSPSSPLPLYPQEKTVPSLFTAEL